MIKAKDKKDDLINHNNRHMTVEGNRIMIPEINSQVIRIENHISPEYLLALRQVGMLNEITRRHHEITNKELQHIINIKIHNKKVMVSIKDHTINLLLIIFKLVKKLQDSLFHHHNKTMANQRIRSRYHITHLTSAQIIEMTGLLMINRFLKHQFTLIRFQRMQLNKILQYK